MSETTDKPSEAMTQEEKIEMAKILFSTLEIDQKAIFAQWCHEEVEKGGVEFLGQKMSEVNDKFNSFVARASDSIKKGATFIYDKTNEAFEVEEDTNDEKSGDEPSFFDK